MEVDKLIFELDESESKWWGETIIEFRSRLVKEPRRYTDEVLGKRAISLDQLKKSVDSILEEVRQEVWELYLIDEANFHKEVLAHLVEVREVPRDILTRLIDNKVFEDDYATLSREELVKRVAEVVGDYAGRIMPYIYALSLSTTNSRRSRSGKTFEAIIEAFMDIYAYPYQNQSSLGREFFEVHKLGKKVDLIVPSADAYSKNRAKCAVVTAKTSLRERWQEVAEELQRTNVPHIFLLTADDAVTGNTVDIIGNYNITLVVYSSEKDSKFKERHKVIDYRTFFNDEMPHIIGYWSR